MSSAILEESEAAVARDPDTVGADLQIMRRHLRRKVGVEWGDPTPNGEFPGTIPLAGKAWYCDLSYREKYDQYRFRFYIREDHSNAIARRFDVHAKNAYTLCNDVIAVHSTLNLVHILDLEKD